ncbi:MAG TPA: carboxypeptidase-like regulatory domain-containing protein, partial [Tepidisphaeraceae bacterium]|nr:carboxypeptidase-like regulatory domain-containing protein [Tepidisphaeraceae bacterium]
STTQAVNLTSPISAGEVTHDDRNDLTEFLQVSKTKLIPAGTRSVTIELSATLATPSYNDAYADDISFKLSSSAPKGFISGTISDDGQPNDGGMMSALPGVSVFIDSNKNGKFDKGELTAKTHSNGRYSFANISRGTYSVVEMVPGTFRAITASTTSVTVRTGLTSTQDFTLSQSVLIGGQVFADKNNDNKIDSGDVADDGQFIYLDTNNNGQFDAYELHTITTPKGNWRLTIPFGTYIIREQLIGTTKQILPAKSVAITFSKGEVSIKNNLLNSFVSMGL